MPAILIPRVDSERRTSAHRVDDGRVRSLCGIRTTDDCDVYPDTPETWARLRAKKYEMCWHCDGILRDRAIKAQREAERKATPLPKPTKREIEAEKLARWNAAAQLAANPPPKHDEDHVADAGEVVQ
jgi:hypothetical protein